MKKQFGLPLMLASALAFSACSSDDVAENGPKDIAALTDGGYLKMSINLPSRAANGGFRATEEQDGYVSLQDGLAKEYNVKDAILVLFQGDNEADATFHSAYKLTTSMQMDGSTQITSTTKLVKKVNIGGEGNPLTPAAGNKLYALVILNNNGLFAVDANNKLMYATSNLDDATSTGTTTTPTPTIVPTPAPAATTVFNGTFSAFQKITVTGGANSFRDDTKGFLMMNAPLYKTAATTAPSDLATLAVVTGKVKNTETEAQNEPGAEVFVERAVAKVTMAPYASGQLTGNEYASAANKVDVKLVAWGLDYMNNISYYMHNAKPVTTGIADWAGFNVNGDAGSNYYRFAGATEVKTGYGYRAYWGEDPNYNAAPETGSSDIWGSVSQYKGEKCNFIHVTNIDDLSDKTGENYPQYCMENTFNVANMNEDQTTRAIVKVKLTPNTTDADGSFYIVNNDKSKFFNLAGIKNLVKDHILACNTVTTQALTSGTAAVNVNDIELEPVVGSPDLKVKSFKVTYGPTATTTAVVKTYDATTAAVVKEVNDALSTVTKYTEGYAYYPIRIKHFGSSKALAAGGYDTGMVTWNSASHSQKDRYNGNSDEKFLGRYGVLRNNWYDLGINSISGVGSPVIPNAPGTPDDELESFISVRINVLSWAKRVQREDL